MGRTIKRVDLVAWGRNLVLALAVGVVGMGLALSPVQASSDEVTEEKKPSHEGYYYPELTSEETYVSRGRIMEEAERTLRVGFVTAFANGMMESPVPLPFVIFAKGAEAQKLIIVAVKDGPFDTLFRARANLAQLTAVARTMPLLADYGVQDWFTYFDLIRMLGFEEIVVSDGKTWAHRINLK